jgi:heptosyltransferase-2
LLNDIRYLDKTRYPLMIDQFMALGLEPKESLPTKRLYPSLLKEPQDAIKLNDNLNLSERPVLALAPGAEYGQAKRWPEEYFAQVANNRLDAGWDVWLFGSAKDLPITEKIMALTKHLPHNFAGRITLAQTIDLLALSHGLVSNDSGLMHVASALQKPVVAIYGSTSPAFTPPLSEHASILKLQLDCQPCFKRTCPLQHYRCLRDLTPDRVITVIERWGA